MGPNDADCVHRIERGAVKAHAEDRSRETLTRCNRKKATDDDKQIALDDSHWPGDRCWMRDAVLFHRAPGSINENADMGIVLLGICGIVGLIVFAVGLIMVAIRLWHGKGGYCLDRERCR